MSESEYGHGGRGGDKHMHGEHKLRQESAYAQNIDDFHGQKYASEPSDARISNQLMHLNEQLHKMTAQLSELQDRLDPILIPNEAMPSYNETTTGSVPRKAGSDLSNAIDDSNTMIYVLQSKIRNMTERVQL